MKYGMIAGQTVFTKGRKGLAERLTEAEEKIKFIEEKLYLIILLFLGTIALLEVVKTSIIELLTVNFLVDLTRDGQGINISWIIIYILGLIALMRFLKLG